MYLKFQKICRCALFLIVGLTFSSAFAQDANTPDGLVRMVVEDVMTAVRTDPAMQAGDIKKIQQLVEKKILPHSNFEKATELAMGASWKQASAEQRAQILHEFKTLLIRTYAGAISQIRDQKVQFKPLRVSPDDPTVVVSTTVINHGDAVPINYRLAKFDGAWKVFDINVLGAWLVQVYRGQFREQIARNGIDGLIQFLKDRNQSLINDGK